MRILRTVTCAIPIALVACQSTPPEVFSSLEPSTELHSVNPADIAILPIEDATSDKLVTPLIEHMREQIALALVGRMYTPLAPARIDKVLGGDAAAGGTSAVSVIDASWLKSLSGRFGEDATLAVRITAWNDSSLMANGRVRFAADVLLVSPGVDHPLWSGVFEGEVKAGGTGPAPRERTARARAAAAQFAIELIRPLPRRRL